METTVEQLNHVERVDIAIQNLAITLQPKPPACVCLFSVLPRRKNTTPPKPKTLLAPVSATAPAGSITAILGPSGSGKTTLLNALAGRGRHALLQQEGQVAYNGYADVTAVRSAYLAQQDVLEPTLTVRETLSYAAGLRMPAGTAAAERAAQVERVIGALGLQHCADTRIGGSSRAGGRGGRSGCSGGERRRTSLGVQMLAQPSVLLLDEATTGLDAATALQLVQTLVPLARRGYNIVMTIHQPRSEMWELFDHVILLGRGSTLYSGPREQCLAYFADLGHRIEQHVNPAEFLMDLATAKDAGVLVNEIEHRKLLSVQKEDPSSPISTEMSTSTNGKALKYRKAPFARSVSVQFRRTLKTSWRDPMGITACLIQSIVFSIVTGWIYLHLDGTQSGIRSRQGALYTIVVLQNFIVIVFETFRLTIDIQPYDREKADGVASAASWLLSRRLAKFCTEDVLGPLLYSAICYFMIGFRNDAQQFFIFFAVALIGHYLAVTTATIAVASSRDFAGASVVANSIFTFNSLSCGMFIQSQQLPVYVRWLKYVTHMWYASGAVMTNEFTGHSRSPNGYLYACPYENGAADPDCKPWTGKFILETFGYPMNAWLWKSTVFLLVYAVVFTMLAWRLLQTSKSEISAASTVSHRPEDNTATGIDQEQKDCGTTSPECKGIAIRLQDCSLDIEQRQRLSWRKQTTRVLTNLDVAFKPGQLNVIMGLSGGGKTSLLDLIAARLQSTMFTRFVQDGLILFDGQTTSTSSRRALVSYLQQSDDALIPTLTVRETLHYAAQLRLPSSMTHDDKERQAHTILCKLGLEHCADVLIGNETLKGISGGEKRRVSIAMQLFGSPRVFLLDEPTSGLDASAASAIVALLHELAREGCTVIVTLHQPRSSDFMAFDQVLLLGRNGQPVFSGTGHNVIRHLDSLRGPNTEHVSAADLALDVMCDSPLNDRDESQQKRESIGVQIASRTTMDTQGDETSANSQSLHVVKRRPMGFFGALGLLLRRNGMALRHSSPALTIRTTQALSFLIILTLFFARLKNNYEGVQAYAGLLQQLLGFCFVGMSMSIAVYPLEQLIFGYDFDDGVYGVEAFLACYTILEVPFEIFSSLLSAMLTTLAIGLPRTGQVFGVIAIVTFALINIGESASIMVCTLIPNAGVALSVTGVLLATSLLLAGIFSTSLHPLLRTASKISPGKWAISTMAPYTFKGLRFTCSEGQRQNGKCPIENGDDVLELYHLNNDDARSLGFLLLLMVCYRFAAYLLLKARKSRLSARWLQGRRTRASSAPV